MRWPPTPRALAAALATALLAVGALAATLGHAEDQGWEHEETTDGVALFVREVDAHSYDVVKAVATLDVRVEVLIGLLRDIEGFPRWYHECKATRVLERPARVAQLTVREDGRVEPAADESYVLFFLQDSSPLEDRWAVLRNRVRFHASGAVIVDFASLDSRAYAAPAGSVRMRLSGRWTLSPVSRSRTRVELELDVDPKTSTPTFLVDPRLHAVPLQTLRNLRRVAREPRALQLGRAALATRAAPE